MNQEVVDQAAVITNSSIPPNTGGKKKLFTQRSEDPRRPYPFRGSERIGFGLGFDSVKSNRAETKTSRQVIIIDAVKADAERLALQVAYDGALAGTPFSEEYARNVGRELTPGGVAVEVILGTIRGGLVRDRRVICPANNMPGGPLLHQFHYMELLDAIFRRIPYDGPDIAEFTDAPWEAWKPLPEITKRRFATTITTRFFAENDITSPETYDAAVAAFVAANPKSVSTGGVKRLSGGKFSFDR